MNTKWLWIYFSSLALVLACGPAATAMPTSRSALGTIAFQSDRDGNEEIYVMNADGSNQVNITNNTADDESPSWSPTP